MSRRSPLPPSSPIRSAAEWLLVIAFFIAVAFAIDYLLTCILR